MSTNNASDGARDPIEVALIAFRKAWHSGERPDPEDFCRRHPECGPELIGKIYNFLLIADGLECPVSISDRKVVDDGLTSGKTLGDFRIVRELGRGGMATVYEAEQISLNRNVALKILPSHLTFSDQSIRKFYREAEAGGRQSHPGIVAIHAIGEHEGRYYIAQELVHGSFTLADKLNKLRNGKELPIGYFREAARLIARVGDALEHSHGLRVIHRDIKPSNILLTKDGDPKVTDFGLAKVEDALSLSRTGDFAGTPNYMSPEQAQSRRIKINHRTDIYSLGVTLYEMLTLRLPFEGKTSHEVLKKIVSLEPSDPRKLNPRVPRDLAVICLKAIEKDPNRRYQTMADFSADLQRFLQGETIQAKPAGLGARVWKRLKRNPVVSVTSVAAMLAVVALVLYVLWSYPQILEERDKAVKASEEAKRQQDAAILANEEMEKEIEKTTVINAFLLKMFASPEPRVDGRDVKVVDVLEKIEDEIESTLFDQPEVESSVRATLGTTYVGLGLYSFAETHIRKELALCNRLFGPDHRNTLSAMSNLAVALQPQGKYTEAVALQRKTFDIQKRVLGEDHPDTIKSLGNIASMLLWLGKYPEAESLSRKALEARKRVLGEDNLDSIQSKSNLGLATHYVGRSAEAEILLREATDAYISQLGKEHPDTLICMHNLVLVLNHQDKYSEAVPLNREVLELELATFGEDHKQTLSTMEGLAFMLTRMGNFGEAESLFLRVLNIHSKTLGEKHPTTLKTMKNIANMLRVRGDFLPAECLQRSVLEDCFLLLGEDHPDTIVSMDSLALTYDMQGKFSEAEALFRRLLSLRRRLQGDFNIFTLITMKDLADAIRRQGRYSEAEPILREVLEIEKTVRGRENLETVKSMNNLGLVLSVQGKFSEAESLLIEAIDVQKRMLGEEHDETMNSSTGLAIVLYQQKKYEEAEPILLNSLAVMRRVRGEKHPRTRSTMKRLVKLYEVMKKPEKAAEYRAILSK